MKFSTLLVATVAAVGTTVSAAPQLETNAQRMARGLPPLPPVRRASGTEVAKRGSPSGTPGGSCNTGPVQCCQSTGHATDGPIAAILGLLGIVVQDLNVLIGLTCSPVTVIGGANGGCSAKPVCCSDNSHGGLISIGCVPISL
ncbi:hypothetical protein V5O48_002078 [Marasmius crinis-equi]|uniref:Hydrophobin n=1 Tax=Marasmius crinis-equi TaxID=585013 RepID=A0ABR3FX59_9AGAR